MDETITFVIVMLIMAAKTVQWNSPAVRHRHVRMMAFVFHIWKMKQNTNSIAPARLVSLGELVKLSVQ